MKAKRKVQIENLEQFVEALSDGGVLNADGSKVHWTCESSAKFYTTEEVELKPLPRHTFINALQNGETLYYNCIVSGLKRSNIDQDMPLRQLLSLHLQFQFFTKEYLLSEGVDFDE